MATLDNRYTINGLVDTSQTVMQNMETICNTCNTWLTYDAIDGLWSFVINQAGNAVATFNDDNILGGISLATTESGTFYNQCEVRYRNQELRDQEDYVFLEIPANQRYANEPVSRLIIDAPLVNNQIQAQLLGLIELKQSRLEQTIEFSTDYTQLSINAGDIVSITNTVYGWNQRLFRVLRMEEREENNTIVIRITAQEYNAAVYDTSDLFEFLSEKEDGVFIFNPLQDAPPITPFTQVVDENGAPIGDFGDFGELTNLLAGVAATGLLNELIADNTSLTDSVELLAGDNITITADQGNNSITFSSTGGGGGSGSVSANIVNITQANPGVVTTDQNHQLVSGQQITITDVEGMTEVNGQIYYGGVLTGNTFALYSNPNLSTTVNTTGFTAYTGNGLVTGSSAGTGQILTIGSTVSLGTPLAPNETNGNIVTPAVTGSTFTLTAAQTTVRLAVDIYIAQFNENTLTANNVNHAFRYDCSIVDSSNNTVLATNIAAADWVRTMRYLGPVQNMSADLRVSLGPGTYGLRLGGAAGSVSLYAGFKWIVYRE